MSFTLTSDKAYSIENEEVKGTAVSIFRRGKKWYIEADCKNDDERFKFIGPFETPELAWSTLQLIKD